MSDYSTDFEVRKATLLKLGGDPTGLSTIYEVDLAILDKTGGGGLTPVVVTTLPEKGEAGKMYFVPSTTPGEKDNYKEYLWVNNQWECVGNADVDLSDYATIDWALSKFYTKMYIEDNYLTKPVIENNYATKVYVDEKIGDINRILEFIITGD